MVNLVNSISYWTYHSSIAKNKELRFIEAITSCLSSCSIIYRLQSSPCKTGKVNIQTKIISTASLAQCQQGLPKRECSRTRKFLKCYSILWLSKQYQFCQYQLTSFTEPRSRTTTRLYVTEGPLHSELCIGIEKEINP